MSLDGEATVEPQRLGGHRGDHRGIAVAIAADPRGHAQPPAGRRQLRVMLAQRLREVSLHRRHGVPEDGIHEVESRAHLVGDGWARGTRPIREPERRHLRLEGRELGRALPREQIWTLELAEGVADPLQRREHGAALRFRGMRGEHELDVQLGEEGGHLPAADPPLPEEPDRLADRIADGGGIERALAGAKGLDAMAFLGEIDQVEVHGEGGSGGACRGYRERGDGRGELERRCLLPAPASLGQRADLFFRLEQRKGFLLAKHLPQRLAEEMDGGREVQLQRKTRPACAAAIRPRRAGRTPRSPRAIPCEGTSYGASLEICVAMLPRRRSSVKREHAPAAAALDGPTSTVQASSHEPGQTRSGSRDVRGSRAANPRETWEITSMAKPFPRADGRRRLGLAVCAGPLPRHRAAALKAIATGERALAHPSWHQPCGHDRASITRIPSGRARRGASAAAPPSWAGPSARDRRSRRRPRG